MRWSVVLAALALGGARPAAACPTGTTCTALDDVVPTVHAGYTRTTAGMPTGASRRELMAYFTASRWTTIELSTSPYEHQAVSRQIRFADPKQPLDARILRERTIFITRAEQLRDGTIVVELDGTTFRIDPCPETPKTACLVPKSGLPKPRLSVEPALD